jgi:hypothetical protein
MHLLMSAPMGLRIGVRAGLGLALVLGAPGAHAQNKVLGPTACVSCHDHARQAQKWQKEEPLQLKGRAHFNTRKQLEAPRSAAFAKAIGLADPYDLKGSCVQCHATVFKGDANAGVSCESCHGAASAYNVPHQTKGAYATAVSLGLRDLRGKPAEIAKACVDCHVTPDKRLGAAGHPAGETFDAGASLQKIVHWNATYDYAAITANGRRLTAARLGGKLPAPAPPAAGGAKPVAPPPVPGGSGAAAPVAPPAAPATAAPVKPSGSSTASAAVPAAELEPWNWDQPVRALPDDYKPEAEPPADAAPAPETAPAPGAGETRPRKRAPRVPVSIAYESPLPPPIAGSDTGPLSAAVAPASSPEAVSDVAASISTTPGAPAVAPVVSTDVRSRASSLLEKALRAGARGPSLPPATKPGEFAGPDGELLRIQDEAMALAIEALRRPE